MDFRTLRYFVTVAQELNFTRAAEKLNMSQPPLSNQIKEMENDLGVQLFIRGKRHLTLTDAGNLLYRRAVQILELGERTREEIASLGQELSGTLCLGMVEGRAPFFAARWIAGFRDEYPLVKYTLRTGSSDDLIAEMHKGVLDLAIIAAPYDNEHLEGITVGTEPWVAVIPSGHPLASAEGDTISLASLADEPLIIPERPSRIEAIQRWFDEIGRDPHILCTLSSYTNAIALVEQHAGICIFPQTTYTPNPHVVSKVIVDPPRSVQYVLIHSRQQHLSDLATIFVEYVQDFMAEDKIHSERFHVKEAEFPMVEDAPLL